MDRTRTAAARGVRAGTVVILALAYAVLGADRMAARREVRRLRAEAVTLRAEAVTLRARSAALADENDRLRRPRRGAHETRYRTPRRREPDVGTAYGAASRLAGAVGAVGAVLPGRELSAAHTLLRRL